MAGNQCAELLRRYLETIDWLESGRQSGTLEMILSWDADTAPSAPAMSVLAINRFERYSPTNRPFTRAEVESMTVDELGILKDKLGMGQLGPIPVDEFVDIAMAFQESLREQASTASASSTAPTASAASTGGRTLGRKQSSLNRRTGQMECGICLSPMGDDNPVATPPCGHVYCYEFLVRIDEEAKRAGHDSGSCPTCRQRYKKRQILKLFLQ